MTREKCLSQLSHACCDIGNSFDFTEKLFLKTIINDRW